MALKVGKSVTCHKAVLTVYCCFSPQMKVQSVVSSFNEQLQNLIAQAQHPRQLLIKQMLFAIGHNHIPFPSIFVDHM